MPTKIQQASSENIVQAMKFIRDVNPDAVIIEDYQKILNLDLLLGTKQTTSFVSHEDPLSTNANALFRSWNYSATEAMSEEEFQRVLNELPPETVRGKGFLYLKQYPTVRFEFQMVGKSAQVQPKGEWGLQNPRTEIVFISLK